MKIIKFKPTYLKDNGVSVIYNKSIPKIEGFNVIFDVSGLIIIPPGAFGGNHKHPRREAFYTSGNLTMMWIDKNGIQNKESMAPKNGEFMLFVMDPNEPHVIVNNSLADQFLMEFTSEPQYNVVPVKII